MPCMSAMMARQETELEILEEFDQLPTDSNTNLVIKNNPTDENWVKCNKKLCNGLRCTNCKKAWHWRCAGMTEDTVKALVIKENVWECQLCRNADSSCPVCKVKEREIRNLKKNITELESNTEHLTSELKVNYERITDLEDRLTREKKPRKRLDKDLEELRQEFDQLSKLKEKRKRSVSTSSSCDTCDSCSSSDESDRDRASMERERRKVVRKTRKAKRGKDKHGKVKAHESENVAVKERQRINHLKSQTENGGESGDKRQECRTTLSNGNDKSKYDELRDICDSEVEEEIPNESYRMAINYPQKYSAQEAGNAPRSSHSRPRPRTTM